MAKPIATPTAFAPLAPPWSLVSLDANFTNQNNALNDYSLYSNYLTDTSGVANTITVNTPASTAFAYTAGIQVQVKIAITNTSGTVNLNVNSLGNQLVKNPDGTNPVANQLVAGGIYTFQFDGTNFQVIGGTLGFTGFANPTALAGLAAINGVATTAMRSDGAPALDQTISPTWTALHTFNAGLTIKAATRAVASFAQSAQSFGNATDNPTYSFLGSGNTTFGNSAAAAGLTVQAINTSTGTAAWSQLTANNNLNNAVHMLLTSSAFSGPFLTSGPSGQTANIYTDAVVQLVFGTNSIAQLRLVPGTGIQGIGPVNTGFVDMTPDTGTFTVTYVGGTTSPTGTATWNRSGNFVTLTLPALTATSNSTSFSFTGLPAAIQPATLSQNIPLAVAEDNGANISGAYAQVNSGSGTIVFGKTAGTTAWTGAGVKGFPVQVTFSYTLA